MRGGRWRERQEIRHRLVPGQEQGLAHASWHQLFGQTETAAEGTGTRAVGCLQQGGLELVDWRRIGCCPVSRVRRMSRMNRVRRVNRTPIGAVAVHQNGSQGLPPPEQERKQEHDGAGGNQHACLWLVGPFVRVLRCPVMAAITLASPQSHGQRRPVCSKPSAALARV